MFEIKTDDLHIYHREDCFDEEISNSNHRHEFYEIFLFIKGECTISVDKEKRDLLPGDLLFIKPNQVHSLSSKEKNAKCERYVLKFSKSILSERFLSSLDDCLTFYPKNDYFISIIKQLDYDSHTFDEIDMYYMCKCKIWEILLYLKKASQLGKSEQSSSDQVIAQIITYIKFHLTEDITFEDIEKEVGLSIPYIRAQFKKKMHVPLMKYIRSKKILAAREEILSGRSPVDICKKYHFGNYSTFYRDYLSVTGKTPSQDQEENPK